MTLEILFRKINKSQKLSQLLLAQNELRSQSSNFNLIFIGDGIEKPNLESLVKKLNLEKHVWFYGPCYDERDLANLIYNSDLCVSPGNVGLTAIHSLTFGTPVITHNNYLNQMPEFSQLLKMKLVIFFKKEIYRLANTISKTIELIRTKIITPENCRQIIDIKFNPYYQIKVLKEVLL